MADAQRRRRERSAARRRTPESDRDWIWKAVAAVLVPISVAGAPTLFAWVSQDRGVDQIIVESAFNVLELAPVSTGHLA